MRTLEEKIKVLEETVIVSEITYKDLMNYVCKDGTLCYGIGR